MINFFLYSGVALFTVALSALIYGLIMSKAEQYRLTTNKAVEPEKVNVKQY